MVGSDDSRAQRVVVFIAFFANFLYMGYQFGRAIYRKYNRDGEDLDADVVIELQGDFDTSPPTEKDSLPVSDTESEGVRAPSNTPLEAASDAEETRQARRKEISDALQAKFPNRLGDPIEEGLAKYQNYFDKTRSEFLEETKDHHQAPECDVIVKEDSQLLAVSPEPMLERESSMSPPLSPSNGDDGDEEEIVTVVAEGRHSPSVVRRSATPPSNNENNKSVSFQLPSETDKAQTERSPPEGTEAPLEINTEKAISDDKDCSPDIITIPDPESQNGGRNSSNNLKNGSEKKNISKTPPPVMPKPAKQVQVSAAMAIPVALQQASLVAAKVGLPNNQSQSKGVAEGGKEDSPDSSIEKLSSEESSRESTPNYKEYFDKSDPNEVKAREPLLDQNARSNSSSRDPTPESAANVSGSHLGHGDQVDVSLREMVTRAMFADDPNLDELFPVQERQVTSAEMLTALEAAQSGVITKENADILVNLLSIKDADVLIKVLTTMSNCAAFTVNQNLLRNAGALQTLTVLLKSHAMSADQPGQSAAILKAISMTVSNMAVNDENQKYLKDCMPTLVDMNLSEIGDESSQLASLQALTNLSVTSIYHGEYTKIIQKLYKYVDIEGSALQLQALKILVNLSCNSEMVPYLLAARAPTKILDLLSPSQKPDIQLRWVTMLANIISVVKETGITSESLPTDYKAPSPETMFTALYGVLNQVQLKSRVFVLCRSRNSDVAAQATRIYNCFS